MLVRTHGLDMTIEQLIGLPQLHDRSPFGISQAVIDNPSATVATRLGNSIAGVHYHV